MAARDILQVSTRRNLTVVEVDDCSDRKVNLSPKDLEAYLTTARRNQALAEEHKQQVTAPDCE